MDAVAATMNASPLAPTHPQPSATVNTNPGSRKASSKSGATSCKGAPSKPAGTIPACAIAVFTAALPASHPGWACSVDDLQPPATEWASAPAGPQGVGASQEAPAGATAASMLVLRPPVQQSEASRQLAGAV
eukprot:scaffold8383_cov129-Isochrysis_galbana.AAC.3